MKKNDINTPLQDLRDAAKKFCDDRDWQQFHNPKDTAMNLAIESSELLEHFLWKTPEQLKRQFTNDAAYRQEVLDELADVMHACLALANALEGVDVTTAFFTKLEKTSQKYPIAKAKGRANKYNKL
jgi:NTP pyrophosphatase (non-canonical NTP hydrolase)